MIEWLPPKKNIRQKIYSSCLIQLSNFRRTARHWAFCTVESLKRRPMRRLTSNKVWHGKVFTRLLGQAHGSLGLQISSIQVNSMYFLVIHHNHRISSPHCISKRAMSKNSSAAPELGWWLPESFSTVGDSATSTVQEKCQPFAAAFSKAHLILCGLTNQSLIIGESHLGTQAFNGWPNEPSENFCWITGVSQQVEGSITHYLWFFSMFCSFKLTT